VLRMDEIFLIGKKSVMSKIEKAHSHSFPITFMTGLLEFSVLQVMIIWSPVG
jgi:hypothetical protein